MKPEKSMQFSPTPMMLVNRLSKGFRDLMRREGERGGVPDRYRELLIHLVHNDGSTQQELATLVGIKPSSVSVTLRDMERDKFIERKTDTQDQRIVRVFVTEKGKDCHARMRACADNYDACIMQGISDAEREICKKVLLQMRQNLQEIGREE